MRDCEINYNRIDFPNYKNRIRNNLPSIVTSCPGNLLQTWFVLYGRKFIVRKNGGNLNENYF